MTFFFFSSRRRHTISLCDWSSDVCSSDLEDRQCAEDLVRDRVGEDRRVRLAERNDAADLVVQLPNVPGPAVEEEALHRFFGDREVAFAEIGGRARDELVHEAGDLVAPFAE